MPHTGRRATRSARRSARRYPIRARALPALQSKDFWTVVDQPATPAGAPRAFEQAQARLRFAEAEQRHARGPGEHQQDPS